MNKNEFTACIGGVFEHSSAIAEAAWQHRPFQSLHELDNRLITAMYQSEPSTKLALLRAHPDLGTRMEISTASMQEQKNAGLTNLTEEEYHRFSLLNKSYTEKFGFPFIMAVKGQDKITILKKIESRLSNSSDVEMATGLKEVSKIVRFRLEALIDSSQRNGHRMHVERNN
nr:2-oxo-4-hydroxy-4-carboxy-5-ureidoimidazoline decarboxylase [Evansella caseinilytica]